MNDIKVVVFDCDGVMFDTEDANREYYNKILNHCGKPDMTPKQFVFTHMHTVDDSIAYLFNNDEKLIKEAQAFRKEASYVSMIKYMKIEPYLKPLLKKLRYGYNTAVATNRTDTMNRVLKEHGLDSYYDLVITALDVDRPKPYPDQLIKILEHFKIEPSMAMYIGDSEVDAAAADTAGVPFAAYNNNTLPANFHITSLKEIEDILQLN